MEVVLFWASITTRRHIWSHITATQNYDQILKGGPSCLTALVSLQHENNLANASIIINALSDWEKRPNKCYSLKHISVHYWLVWTTYIVFLSSDLWFVHIIRRGQDVFPFFFLCFLMTNQIQFSIRGCINLLAWPGEKMCYLALLTLTV